MLEVRNGHEAENESKGDEKGEEASEKEDVELAGAELLDSGRSENRLPVDALHVDP